MYRWVLFFKHTLHAQILPTFRYIKHIYAHGYRCTWKGTYIRTNLLTHTVTLCQCGHRHLRQLCEKSHCVSSQAPQHQHEA